MICQAPGCCNLLKPNPRGRRPKWCSDRCRKSQYAGVCVDCGGPTAGSEGLGRRQPKRCRTCVALDPELVAAGDLGPEAAQRAIETVVSHKVVASGVKALMKLPGVAAKLEPFRSESEPASRPVSVSRAT